MLANLKSRDFLAQVDGGFPPGTSLSVGTNSGKVFLLGGPGPIRKYSLWLQAVMGTASGVLTAFIQTATASNGTFSLASGMANSLGSATLAALSGSIALSVASLRYNFDFETRGEALGSLGGTWAQIVAVVTGAAMPACLTTLGYNVGGEPAGAYDSATISTTEQVGN